MNKNKELVWLSVDELGLPKNRDIGYLVSDGYTIEFSFISDDDIWTGGSVFSTEPHGFEYNVKFFTPTTFLNLPK